MKCKVKLTRVTKLEQGYELTYLPVTHGEFFKYTPYGEIKLGVVNENVVRDLEPGKEYYVEFTEAL